MDGFGYSDGSGHAAEMPVEEARLRLIAHEAQRALASLKEDIQLAAFLLRSTISYAHEEAEALRRSRAADREFIAVTV